MRIEGKVIKYGDNINTDEIIPARFLNTSDPKELAKHCMEGIDKNFLEKLKWAKILVAGKNFGCGSSREHAPIALKEAGVACIIASSFARIFFRNAINIGLPIVESERCVERIEEGETYSITPFPPFLQALMDKGGLGEYIKERIMDTAHFNG